MDSDSNDSKFYNFYAYRVCAHAQAPSTRGFFEK